jgi:hypothetical protein
VRIVALGALGLACHSADPRPAQSEAEALSHVCTAPDWSKLSPAERDAARDRWADAQITNPEMRRFVATLSERDAWDGMTQLLQRAEAAKLASCTPRVFSGTRAPNRDLVLPTIKDATNAKLEAAPSVTVTATHITVGELGTFATSIPPETVSRLKQQLPVGTTTVMIAADGRLALRALAPALDPLRKAPIDRFKLAVISGGEITALTFGFEAAPSSTSMIVVQTSGITLEGKELPDPEVRSATKSLGLAAIVFDPDLTVQRLAEVLSEVAVPVIVVPQPTLEPAPQQAPPDMSSCAPLELRLDGKAMQPKTLLARGHTNGGIEVVISDHALTCDELLKPARAVDPTEITAEVIVKRDPTAVALDQVVWDNDIESSTSRLLRTAPSSVGDQVDVCVARATLHGHFGHQHQTLDIAGLAHARYCGLLVD